MLFRFGRNPFFHCGESFGLRMFESPADDGAGSSVNDGGSLLTDDNGSQDERADGNNGDEGDGDDGDSNSNYNNWTDALPKEYRDHPAIKDLQKPGDMAAAYVKLLDGDQKVVLPGEDATDEDWAEFFGSIGRPDSSEGYNLELSEDFPDSMKAYIDDEFINGFKEEALAAGLRPDQATKLFEGVAKSLGERASNYKETLRSVTEKQLKSEWKNGFKENLKKSQKALKKLFGEDFAKYLEDTGLGNDARMIKGCLAAYEEIGEDRIVLGSPGGDKKEGWNFKGDIFNN